MQNRQITTSSLRWLTLYLFLALIAALLVLNVVAQSGPSAAASNATPASTQNQSNGLLNCEQRLHMTCQQVINTVSPKPKQTPTPRPTPSPTPSPTPRPTPTPSPTPSKTATPQGQ